MAKAPPQIVIHIPPAQTGAKGTAWTKYATWAKKQGIDKLTAGDIWYWSHHLPNVDPYLYTSVLVHESGGKQYNPDGSIRTSGQAVGIGQIAKSWVGQHIPWSKNPKAVFTLDNDPQTGILNYGVNLRFGATLWGSAVAKYGWQNAYTQGYNPNDPHNQDAWAAITKTYTTRPGGAAAAPPNSPSSGPADTSATSQYGTSTTPTFNDPFVAGVDRHGKLVTTNDPNKAKQYDGVPLSRSGFLTLRDQLSSHYISYTGKRPSLKQIDNFVTNGWNTYTLDNLLSKSANFKKSPIYKQYQANLSASVKDLLPAGTKVPDELLRQAVVNNWTADAVAQKIRQLPQYLKSNEFKGNVTTLMNVYQSIMGNPPQGSQQALTEVRDAALAGWTTDQFASFLRSHNGYSTGTEYQSKALGFLGALGLITGARPVLQQGTGMYSAGPGGPGPDTTGKLPTDKRVKGDPNAQAPTTDLMATLG